MAILMQGKKHQKKVLLAIFISRNILLHMLPLFTSSSSIHPRGKIIIAWMILYTNLKKSVYSPIHSQNRASGTRAQISFINFRLSTCFLLQHQSLTWHTPNVIPLFPGYHSYAGGKLQLSAISLYFVLLMVPLLHIFIIHPSRGGRGLQTTLLHR